MANPRAALSALSSVGRSIASAIRGDAWVNEITGLGLPDFDRSKNMQFRGEAALATQVLTNLYRSDDIVRKIVGYFPEESFRRGLCYEGETCRTLQGAFERFGLIDKVQAAAIWGRLYGGACLAIEADGKPDEPLRYRKGMPIYGFRVFNREALTPQPFHNGQRTQRSKSLYYRVQPVNESSFIMHRSRAIWFGGIRTPDQIREGDLNGWEDSALQPVINAIASFNNVDGAIDNLVTDASQGVFKMRGLLDTLAGQPELAETRARFLNFTRSICSAIFLDADSNESFEKIATSFVGLPETWDRKAQRVASAAGFPVTVLWGTSPAGLNATGASDLENFDNRTLSYRETELVPAVNLLSWILSTDESRAVFPPMKVPTEEQKAALAKTKAETRKLRADTMNVYVQAQIMLPEQAAKQMYDEGEIQIDPSLLDVARYQPEPKQLPAGTPAPDASVPKIEVTPSDVVTVVKVNQLLTSMSLPPISEAEGGNLTVSQYQAKNAAAIATATSATSGTPAPPPVVVP